MPLDPNGAGPPAASPPPVGYGYGHVARGPAPQPVVTAVRLMVARSAVSVVLIAVQFLQRDEFRRRVLQRTPQATNSTVDIAFAVGLGIAIAVLVFYLFLAFRVRHGANWARIVVWVIAALAVLGVLAQFAQPYPAATRAVGLVVAAIDVAVIVLLAAPQSNAYFRRH
ncbi:hypothetical protein [uncultured Jatrophihabitans sp.]|uniref:hypothetical protein n=1 Tax=uncultured Jatrophihabitans sp. TaxID=1610747 RepID=UPI0035CBF5F3